MNVINSIGKYLQQGRSWYTRDVKTIKVFSVHHSASLTTNQNGDKTDDEILQELMADHTNQGWPGLSYHFVIIRGTVYQINDISWVTWVDSINWDCIGICVVGYFHPPYNQEPSHENLQALGQLLDDLATNHPEFPAAQGDTYGHRERFATACPGDNLFKYVLEYRSKLGDVTWKNDADSQAQPAQSANLPVQPATLAEVQEKINAEEAKQNESAQTESTPVEDPKYTESQYQEVIRERDEAKQLLQQKSNELIETNKNYSGFASLGYNKVDDVQAALDKKDQDNRGLQSQIFSLKTQLKDAGELFAKNHSEDGTAIEMGMKAADELKTLTRDHESILVAIGAEKPDLPHVLDHLDKYRRIVDAAVKILEKHNVIKEEDVRNFQEKGSNWLGQVATFLSIFVISLLYTVYFIVERGWIK